MQEDLKKKSIDKLPTQVVNSRCWYFMMYVWKIDEDLDFNKEDLERTFSGFSDALLLFAEGGRGKLICKTSLKKRNDKEKTF